MAPMATYLLLDGHSLAYRAWFALQEADLTTASGQKTAAVYGFVSMLGQAARGPLAGGHGGRLRPARADIS